MLNDDNIKQIALIELIRRKLNKKGLSKDIFFEFDGQGIIDGNIVILLKIGNDKKQLCKYPVKDIYCNNEKKEFEIEEDFLNEIVNKRQNLYLLSQSLKTGGKNDKEDKISIDSAVNLFLSFQEQEILERQQNIELKIMFLEKIKEMIELRNIEVKLTILREMDLYFLTHGKDIKLISGLRDKDSMGKFLNDIETKLNIEFSSNEMDELNNIINKNSIGPSML